MGEDVCRVNHVSKLNFKLSIMRKLSKIALLGDSNLLSTYELKQLIGASNRSDGCVLYEDVPNHIRKCTGGSCVTSGQGQSGYCGWNQGTQNCECLVTY